MADHHAMTLFSRHEHKQYFYGKGNLGKLLFVIFIVCALAFSLLAGRSLFAVQASDALVSWRPPKPITPASLPKPLSSDDLMSELRVGDMNVVLEKTPLTSVQSRFGGTIGQHGDAGDYLSWLCLSGANAGKRWILWLESAEIDGGTIGGFRWQALTSTAQVDRRCGHVKDSRGGVELQRPFEPGTSESELLQTLGQPANKQGDRLLFVHEHQVQVNDQSFTATNTISILLHQGAVWAIEVWKSTVS
jgi:hypothetical protein